MYGLHDSAWLPSRLRTLLKGLQLRRKRISKLQREKKKHKTTKSPPKPPKLLVLEKPLPQLAWKSRGTLGGES